MAQARPVRRGLVIGAPLTRNVRDARLEEVAQPALPRRASAAGSGGSGGSGHYRETKLETFRRLAQQRVPHVLKAMSLVEKLGNRELYEVLPSDVATIMATVRAAADKLEQALLNDGQPVVELHFTDPPNDDPR